VSTAAAAIGIGNRGSGIGIRDDELRAFDHVPAAPIPPADQAAGNEDGQMAADFGWPVELSLLV
jgi:hypothetical protein